MNPGLGTQLRHLTEMLDGAVQDAYRAAGLHYRPRYTPVMRVLSQTDTCTIGQIAEAAGISQPAATQTVALMLKDGLVTSAPGPGDGRQRLTRLTDAGRAMLPQLQVCWQATAMAAASLDADLAAPLSDTLRAAIAALEKKSFAQRIAEARDQLPSP